MWSREVHVFIKERVAGKRKNGSNNNDRNTQITIMSKVNGGTTEPRVLQCCIKFWHSAFPSVEGSRVVLYVPGLQHAPCLSVGVRINDRSLGQVHFVVAGEGVFGNC